MCPYGACYNACAMVSNPFLSRAAADMVSVMQLCLLYAAYIYIYIYIYVAHCTILWPLSKGQRPFFW